MTLKEIAALPEADRYAALMRLGQERGFRVTSQMLVDVLGSEKAKRYQAQARAQQFSRR